MMDENADWEADSDLHVLQEAERIKADGERLNRAKARAAEKAKELREQADSMEGMREDSDMEKGYTSLGRMRNG
jgi:hypothetical protein